MAINQIMFGGNVLPCTVERFPKIQKAARKFRRYNIPGRNGDLFLQDDAYENVIQEYQIYAGSDQYGSQLPWDEMAKCLYLNGYQTLQDTYDTTHFRKAVFNGPMDVENSWNTHGRASIEFDCRPERFLLNGSVKTHYTASSDNSFYILKASAIYANVAQYFANNGFDSEVLYAFKIPSSGPFGTRIMAEPVAGMTNIPFGILQTGANPALNTSWENDGAMSENVNTDGLAYLSYYAGWSGGKTLVVPSGAFSWIPYVTYANGSPLDFAMVGGPVELENPYMPSHPNIVLKCTTAHADELCAAIIDQYGIYINNADLSIPYYFIDTENMTLTKAASLTGERYFANNMRVDAGIQLKSGTNQIFTSAAYEMDLTPNWWEL